VPGIDLRQARVLLTNDDGIEAPGLALLERLVAPLVGELWVVAPRHEQSATSHALTIHSPLRVVDLGQRRKAVTGTPTDATLLALRHIMPEPPDLVLSGINRGGNLGGDVLYSGTVGAAMEAALLGVPAVALSQNKVPHHDEQAYSTPGSDEDLIERGWITVTPLSCDLTSHETLGAFQKNWS
jgi:5'-nucleotidase